MSRPSAKILNRIAIGKTHYDYIVKQTSGLWTIFYRGEPFNLVKENRYRDDLAPKYLRTTWANAKSANRLCARLNQYFATEDFTVVCLK
jgi:hypothetical protein